MKTQTFFMNHLRDTKGTHFYVADNEAEAPVKSMYIKRDAIKGDIPKCIKVTVEVHND